MVAPIGKRKRLFTRKRVLAALGVLFAAYFLAVIILVLAGLNDVLGKADVALVLGNEVAPDGTPSARLAARLDRAATLFGEGLFPRIIVSGGTGKEGYPEGDAMRDYLIGKGIPAAAIIVDNLGVDTGASARNTASILASLKLESVFVISQYFHIPRSKLALKKAGVTSLSSAHAKFFELRDFYSIAREVPAYAKYVLK